MTLPKALADRMEELAVKDEETFTQTGVDAENWTTRVRFHKYWSYKNGFNACYEEMSKAKAEDKKYSEVVEALEAALERLEYLRMKECGDEQPRYVEGQKVAYVTATSLQIREALYNLKKLEGGGSDG